MIENHLCGTYVGQKKCEHFREIGSKPETFGNKVLDRCCYYCMSEGKCRKIGNGGSWTGLSPKWCPKRKGK